MSIATAIAKARAGIQAVRGAAVRNPKAAGAVIVGGAGMAGYAAGEYDQPMRRRRRSRGITSREFRTTQRTLKKISKMYAKLPRRAGATRKSFVGGKRTEIVNVD